MSLTPDHIAMIHAVADQAQARARDTYERLEGKPARADELEAFRVGYTIGMEGAISAVMTMIEQGRLLLAPEG